MDQMNTPKMTLPQENGINIASGLYVERTRLVDEIMDVLRTNQHVVLVSPPATGKTSLLDLLEHKIDERVFRCVPTVNSNHMLRHFQNDWGLPIIDVHAMEKPCWILVDDAQLGYSTEFDHMWAFLIKNCNPNVKVVIATTHRDYSAPGCSMRVLPHISINFSETEVDEWIRRFCICFEISKDQANWGDFWKVVKEISRLDNGKEDADEFHIGVVLTCMLDLERLRNAKNFNLTAETAAARSRPRAFIDEFDRCFAIHEKPLLDDTLRKTVAEVLLGEFRNGDTTYVPEPLVPLVRGGILTEQGRFTCQAAQWYYNYKYSQSRMKTSGKNASTVRFLSLI